MVQVLVAVSLLLLNPISLFAQTTADKGSINNELVKAINTFGLGDLQKVQALLDQGADPNARDTDGNTVLQRAVNAVSAKTVALLLAMILKKEKVGTK